MDVKNRQVGVLEKTVTGTGGEVVLFESANFGDGLGVLKPFSPASPAEKFITKPVEEAPAVALQVINERDLNVLPDLMTQIEQMREEARVEDAAKLGVVREELDLIRKGINP